MKAERLALAALLEKTPPLKHCLIGFDGFIDEIVHPIEQNQRPFPSIQALAERIQSFSGKSGNIELDVQLRKIGGNGPILANALVQAGFSTDLIGALGLPQIDPLFQHLGCALHSYSACGHSDCLEFPEGKIILGKMGGQNAATAEQVIQAVPDLLNLLDRSDLFASVNWTMLPMMNRLWTLLLQDWIPRLSPKKRIFFVDLADPAKRGDADLKEALDKLVQFTGFYAVHLGLNRREAERVAALKNVAPWNEKEPPMAFVQRLKEKLPIQRIIFHTPRFAADHANEVKSAYVPHPQLSTGAGDNFNAGYLHGKLLECNDLQSLLLGMHTASFYVRRGKSPSREELALFLKEEIN